MFIPNVFNVFLVLGSTFDVVTVGLSEGIAGASDCLGASDSDPSDPSDPSCLLTINATSLNEKVELEGDDDYMKRWAESYLKQSASNAARNLGHGCSFHGDVLMGFMPHACDIIGFHGFVLRRGVYCLHHKMIKAPFQRRGAAYNC